MDTNCFLTTSHSASPCDHGDGKMKDTKLHVQPDPTFMGQDAIRHRKDTRRENIGNGGNLGVVSSGVILF